MTVLQTTPHTIDRARALNPPDLLAWAESGSSAILGDLGKGSRRECRQHLLSRVRDQIDLRGTLDVLRHGVEMLGLQKPLKLAEFKPGLAELTGSQGGDHERHHGGAGAHTSLSTQALNSKAVQEGMRSILLNHSKLWESLRGE